MTFTYLFVFAIVFQGDMYTLSYDQLPKWAIYSTESDCLKAAKTVPIPNLTCMELGFPTGPQ